VAIFEGTFYHNTLDRWLAALAIAAALWIVLLVLRKVVYHRILAVSQRTETPVDDLLAILLRKTRTWFSLILSVYAGSLVLALPPLLASVLGKAAILAFLLQAAVWGTEAIGFWLAGPKGKKDTADAPTIGLLKFVARIALWASVLLLALDNLGVHITALIAGLGVGGVAVALAVQNILGDLFASLSILLDKPFVIGDFIDVDGLQGDVERIGLKTTRIRCLSGEQLIFSNSDLLKSRIRNYQRMAERRIPFVIKIVRSTSQDKLARLPGLIRETVDAAADARFDRAHFKAFGDSSFDFEVVYWVTSPDYRVYMDVQQAINLEIVRRFREEGIAFATPARAVVIEGAKPT